MGLAVGCSVFGVLPFNLGQNKTPRIFIAEQTFCFFEGLVFTVNFGVIPPSGLTGCEN